VILNKLLRNKCSVRRGDDDDVVIKMNEIALVYFSSSKRRNMKVVASLCSLFSNFRTSSLSFPLSFFLSLSLRHIFKHASSSGDESFATGAAMRKLLLPALFFSSNFATRTTTTETITTSSSTTTLLQREKVVVYECTNSDWSNRSSRGIRTTENRRDRVFRHAGEPSRTIEQTSSESRRAGRGREERAL